MAIIHRLPYAITRFDGGSRAATWDLTQRSAQIGGCENVHSGS
jgi:hypothetical protein